MTRNKHHRETVLSDTRKAAEKQQQEYGLMARRRRLTVTSFDLVPAGQDERHQNLLQQILKYEAVFDSLKLATHSHDKRVSSSSCCSCCVGSIIVVHQNLLQQILKCEALFDLL